MRLPLVLLWLVTTRRHDPAEAAGQQGCCMSYSKVRAVSSILQKGGAIRCHWQRSNEHCNLEAVIVKWRCRRMCVDPNHETMRKLLQTSCSSSRTKAKKLGCLRRKKLKN